MQNRFWLLFISFLTLTLAACGPKPPEPEFAQWSLKKYLVENLHGEYRLVKFEVKEIDQDNEICRINFQADFKATGKARGLTPFLSKLIQKDSFLLEQKLPGQQRNVSGFMIFSHVGSNIWKLTPPVYALPDA